ncbi:hypothetical protein HK102_007429 [Quaeritorhiza haematococci]|nr:hypothetical protein HK102_007429 [Quaeritorhiza haematococci]
MPPPSLIPTPKGTFDLFEYIEQTPNGMLTELQARHIFRQLVSALLFLHQNGLAHRDVKDENVLIDGGLNVKLIDFGSVGVVEGEESGGKGFDRFLGTLQYASPEILQGNHYRGPEADIWALGCLLYIMLAGESPFPNPSSAILSAFERPTQTVSEDCLDLLRWMLEKRPGDRASIADIWWHPWVCGGWEDVFCVCEGEGCEAVTEVEGAGFPVLNGMSGWLLRLEG